ncbi:MAG: hypothetical protein KDC87_16760 [Planctomycetes bacterium]|nr:hypothetical protein [Planctomycetota bacterium]MCB9869063.1 hypothetical protein [Planctomycetota bacterium]MCB9888021.1 hypothetical protein [Planctomycetota bacterium]
MKIEFNNTDGVQDYVSVPAGTYLCRIVDVREGTTASGDVRWSVQLLVAEGEFTGRHAAWDSVVFSARGLNRVRHVFSALGLPTDGKVEVEPKDLLDRQLFATLRPAEYVSPDGTVTRRNEVPYTGYRALDPGADCRPDNRHTPEESDLPF